MIADGTAFTDTAGSNYNIHSNASIASGMLITYQPGNVTYAFASVYATYNGTSGSFPLPPSPPPSPPSPHPTPPSPNPPPARPPPPPPGAATALQYSRSFFLGLIGVAAAFSTLV